MRVFADSEAMAEEIARRWYHGAELATKAKVFTRLSYLAGLLPLKFIIGLPRLYGLTKYPGTLFTFSGPMSVVFLQRARKAITRRFAVPF